MDANRFDSLARALSTIGTRRRALVVAFGGALGLVGLTRHHEAEAGGRCNPACGECQGCKKGKCHKTRHGKKCKKGTCRAIGDGTACTTGTCQGGLCTCIASGGACPPSARVCCNPGSGNPIITCGSSGKCPTA